MAPVPTAPSGWSAIKVGNEVFFWPASEPVPKALDGTHNFSELPNYRIPDSWGKQPPSNWQDLYRAANLNRDTDPFKVLATTPPAPPPPPPPPAPGAPPPDGQVPPTPGGDGPQDPKQDGAAADAVKKLETSLKNQNSKTADADRTLAEAVLNAHTNTVESQKKLDSLKQEIEDAVKNQTTLDTPMGAREFSKFLMQKQQEILAIATDANTDDKDKQAILAGLGYLNAASADDPKDQNNGQGNGNSQGNGQGGGQDNGQSGGNQNGGGGDPSGTGLGAGNDAGAGGDPLASLLGGDPLGGAGLGDGSGGPLSGLSGLTSGLGGMVPQLGGGGMGGGLPGLFGGGGDSGNSGGGSGLGDLLDKPSNDHHHDDLGANPLDPSNPGDPTTDKPGDKPGLSPDDPNNKDKDHPGDKPNNDNPTPTPGAPVPGQLAPPAPPGTGPTPVTLPNGTTVTAPNPQLANVSKLVASGTPLADAFHQNGINWPPPPGTAVHTPMDPSKITTGYVGQFADHQVFAFDKNWVWINGQLHPIADASGPGFLGWMAPPDVPTAPTSAAPVVTTAAVSPAPAVAAPAAPAATPAAAHDSNLLIPAHK